MAPLVTIGITAYNAEDTIVSALQSALAQDWTAREIIIVDDCSTDATAERVKPFTTGGAAVQLIVNTRNLGVAQSRNRIIEAARGDFIAFFDDDDTSAANRVSTQVRNILDYQTRHAAGAMILCHTDRRQIYPDGSERTEHTMGTTARPAPAGPAVARRILMGDHVEDAYGSVATCSQMAHTATYRKLGGFDPALRRSEDTDLCIRAAIAGAHFLGIAEPLVAQRMTSGSEKKLAAEQENLLRLVDKHREFFDSEAAYHFSRDWLDMKYDWLSKRRVHFGARLAALTLRHPVWVLRRLRAARAYAEGNRALQRLHRLHEAPP